MAVIAPAILAGDPHEYREQIERVQTFAKRLHIDLTDEHFARSRTIDLQHVWWPPGIRADLHLMYKRPTEHIRKIVQLKPQLVIVHAEAEGDFVTFSQILRKLKIRVGVALLPKTPAEAIFPALQFIDHVMIFSGKLGHYGGQADLALLAKAQAVTHHKPAIEIGWDGGVTEANVHLLVAGGVNVLTVGGAIQKASNPAAAYATLKARL